MRLLIPALLVMISLSACNKKAADNTTKSNGVALGTFNGGMWRNLVITANHHGEHLVDIRIESAVSIGESTLSITSIDPTKAMQPVYPLLRQSDSCSGILFLSDGDVGTNEYLPDASKENWVKISTYNPASAVVVGSMHLTLYHEPTTVYTQLPAGYTDTLVITGDYQVQVPAN